MADRRCLPGSERPRSSESKDVEALLDDETVAITFILRSCPDAPPMPDLEYWQNTPLNKRKFLSPQEFSDTYGPLQSDIDAVVFAESHGMKVPSSHRGRRHVSVQGTAKQINSAFGIELHRYESPLPKVSKIKAHESIAGLMDLFLCHRN